MKISWNENGRTIAWDSYKQSEILRYIPKKLLPHVQDVFHDTDGYWIFFDCFVDTNYDSFQSCGMIHEVTIRELRKRLSQCVIYALN